MLFCDLVEFTALTKKLLTGKTAKYLAKRTTKKAAQRWANRRIKDLTGKTPGQAAILGSKKQGQKLAETALPKTTEAIKNLGKRAAEQEKQVATAPLLKSKKTTPKKKPQTVDQALSGMGATGGLLKKTLKSKKAPSNLELGKTIAQESLSAVNPLNPKKMRSSIAKGKDRQAIMSGFLADKKYAPTLASQAGKAGLTEVAMNVGPANIAGNMGAIKGAALGTAVGGPVGGVLGGLGGGIMADTATMSGMRMLQDTAPQIKKAISSANLKGKTPAQKIKALPGIARQSAKNIKSSFDPTEYRRDFLGPVLGQTAATSNIPLIGAATGITHTPVLDDAIQSVVKGKKGVKQATKESTKKLYQKGAGITTQPSKLGRTIQQGRDAVTSGLSQLPDYKSYAKLNPNDPRVQYYLDRFQLSAGKAGRKRKPVSVLESRRNRNV